MGLEKKFSDLNKMAKEIEDTIYKINVEYLKGNVEYPYRDINVLTDKYRLVYEKVYKRKKSSFNKLLGSLSVKKREIDDNLMAPDVFKVLENASERTVPYILEDVSAYVPVDEVSEKVIQNKLFPIVKDLELGAITSLYGEFKNNLSGNLESASYLQKMFVSYVTARLSHNPMDKGFRSRFIWSYEEVCEKFLKEPVLVVDDKENGKSR